MKKLTKTDKTLMLSRAFMQKYGFTYLPREAIAVWGEAFEPEGKRVRAEKFRLLEEKALRKLRRYGIFKIEDLNYLCRIAARHYSQ